MRYLNTLVLAMTFLTSTDSFSNVSLPGIFGDNMVLQRNSDVKIWGWAKPGEPVQLSTSWTEEIFNAKVANNGYWELFLATPDLRGEQEITIEGYNKVVLKNVLLGEVWLVSGQSNMEWSAADGIEGAEEAVAGADNAQLRFFSVDHRTSKYPQQDLEGSWVSSTPETMKTFSAVAYFFGKKLNQELDVPIGLINSSWGGTPAEVWMPAEVIDSNPQLSYAASLLPEVGWSPKEPAVLYNSMIAPLIPFKLAGALWYQGESNTDNAEHYKEIFSNLISSWREKWNDDFPFFFAQIAPFQYEGNFNGVKVRDAQRRVLKLPKTGMVITSDIGNINDIHPRNKKDVGLRFANLALSRVYGKEGIALAPELKNIERKNERFLIHYSNAQQLHADKKAANSLFEVAGKNGKFFPAQMKINKDKIEVWSKEVTEPVFVRYAWGDISNSNIFNEAGLPVSSFTEEVKQDFKN